MESWIEMELRWLHRYYPDEVAQVRNALFGSASRRKKLACRRLNKIRGMIDLGQILWQSEEVIIDDPIQYKIAPRYTMLEGEPLSAHFDTWGTSVDLTAREAARLLGKKTHWIYIDRGNGRRSVAQVLSCNGITVSEHEIT